jgi:hypothetical protein
MIGELETRNNGKQRGERKPTDQLRKTMTENRVVCSEFWSCEERRKSDEIRMRIDEQKKKGTMKKMMRTIKTRTLQQIAIIKGGK